MQTVHIVGDSWGVGEWGRPCDVNDSRDITYQVLHPGTQQFLVDCGYSVIQWSMGSTNCDQHADIICDIPHDQPVIWFVTDPMRSRRRKIPLTWSAWQHTKDDLFRDAVMKISHPRCAVLGGVYELPTWCTTLANITVLCSSIQRWLLPHRSHCDVMCRLWHMPRRADHDLIDYLTVQESQLVKHLQLAAYDTESPEHLYFWPDGQHPNRTAHKRITDELIVPWLREVSRRHNRA